MECGWQMQDETTPPDAKRLYRAPKLQHLDPDRIVDLNASGWRRRKTLVHLDRRGQETTIRVRRSPSHSEGGYMEVADIDCRFEVDDNVVGFCEMSTFRARSFVMPSDCYPEMDGHSDDGRKLNLLLQTRFEDVILEYGSIVALRRIQFLPTWRPGAWIEPFNHLLDATFRADEWAFIIGTPFPLEYEAHQQDDATSRDAEAFGRRREALARLYASRLGFQRLRNDDDEWVWRPIGPRCTVGLIQGLIYSPDQARPVADRYQAPEADDPGDGRNDFDVRP